MAGWVQRSSSPQQSQACAPSMPALLPEPRPIPMHPMGRAAAFRLGVHGVGRKQQGQATGELTSARGLRNR